MKRGTIWRISVCTAAEAEDAVAELLSRLLVKPASSYTDARTGVTTVAVFCDALPADIAAKRVALCGGLRRIKACGLEVAPGKISVGKIRREDWAESWKRHFKPMEIGNALLLRPSWSKRRPRKGQRVVVLDPGLSFGTGQHPTTAYCLRQIVARRTAGQVQSLLDIGTGSGILAIAAAKLGYAPVRAIDSDPEAVRIARANARTNGALHKIRIVCQELTELRPHQRYDLVCANLVSTLILGERRRLVRCLRPGGALVVAGILKSEFPRVRKAFRLAGLRLVAGRTEGEWRSGTFVFTSRQGGQLQARSRS